VAKTRRDDVNRLKTAQLLIDAGADLNVQDACGNTALIVAVRDRNLDMANLLIDAGADLNLQNKDGKTALIEFFYAHDPSNADILNRLIRAGADLNIQDEKGRTALMHATHQRCLESMKCLVDSGADMNLANQDGDTVVMLKHHGTGAKKKREIMQFWVEAGADMTKVGIDRYDVIQVLKLKPLKLIEFFFRDNVDILEDEVELVANMLPDLQQRVHDGGNYEHAFMLDAVIRKAYSKVVTPQSTKL